MSNALSALTGHYEKLRNQTFEVPGVTQSDGKPLVIHYDPPTNADGQMVKKRAGATNEGQITLYTVIYLAKNPDGSRMFEDNADTVQALTEQVPGRVLTQIAAAIMSFSSGAALGN